MNKKYSLFIFILIALFISSRLAAQESPEKAAGPGPAEALPSGFMNIALGMDIESVKKELSSNSWFDYRGDPDVSMLMESEQQLIESDGFSYIRKGYFQFSNGRLFIITLVLDNERLDFYTMHQVLEKKYGKAVRIDPKGAYWEDEGINLYLEKPLSVKYMDKKILDEITSGRKVMEETGSRIKGDFLKLF